MLGRVDQGTVKSADLGVFYVFLPGLGHNLVIWHSLLQLQRPLPKAMLKIVASGGAKPRRQKGQKPSDCFRFDGRAHGSRVTPFAFIGTMSFDSSASAEHVSYPRVIDVAR
jgi:hypothetical protein